MKAMTFTLATFAMSLVAAMATADEPTIAATPETEIRKAVEAYVQAFNKADAKALAAMWSPEAVYINPLSGDEVVGREAIEKQFTAILAETKGAKLEAATDSVQFISPGVAVEHGTARLMQENEEPEESQTTSIFVKRDGKWLLDRVTEETIVTPLSHYEQLKDLQWMVGKWTDQDDVAKVTTECNWTRNNNFLVRSFAIEIADRIDMSGMQIIGWDPAAKQIRSWVFDSDGGFGEGTWTKKGNRWSINQRGVLPDGGKTSSVNIFTYLDDNTCTLQSVNRTVDGELLPNIDEVTITKE
jgi:uncharacterized protein (TIGR02246 family)